MERVFAAVGLLALLTGGALGQSTPPSPVFEAADVHLTPKRPFMGARADLGMNSRFLPTGRYELHTATMADLIRLAYDVEAEAVFGGPIWLETERFDVIAKAPNSTAADRRLMLQALLAERFKLVVHKTEKPVTVFALTVAKKVQLKQSESETPGEAACRPVQQNANGPAPYAMVNCRNMTMADFAKQMAGAYLRHPVVDLTGLKGSYDFTLKWMPWYVLRFELGGDPETNPHISFSEAVEKQLGLKFTEEKRPMPVLAVDSVNRTPTANSPGVAKILGIPDEFEVASVKPSQPDSKSRPRIDVQPGGRVEIVNTSLRTLIAMAWNLDTELDMIIGGPKWIDSDNFDIVAKTTDSTPLTYDGARPLIQALLKERFQLAVHSENRPVPVWTLVVGKRGAKLTKADPSGRFGCRPVPGELGTGTSTIPMFNLTCRNTTMAQFADAMHGFARLYVDRPAADMTGLKDAYDFNLSWTPKRANLSDSGQITAGSDPSGGLTFFEALDKQLGLRLESGQKHPIPLLVIDHVDRAAAEN